MSEPILCPNCGHDIGRHATATGDGCWVCNQLFLDGKISRYLDICDRSQTDIARALLAERDSKLAAVRKVRDHWAGAEYESLREQNIIDTIVDDFTDALGGTQ